MIKESPLKRCLPQSKWKTRTEVMIIFIQLTTLFCSWSYMVISEFLCFHMKFSSSMVISNIFFFPYDTGEALAFLLWKVGFFRVFFFFFTKSHLSCAFGSFPSFSVINLTNRIIALVFLKGFWMNVFSHLSCDCKYFWFLSFDREKVSMLLCILYFS